MEKLNELKEKFAREIEDAHEVYYHHERLYMLHNIPAGTDHIMYASYPPGYYDVYYKREGIEAWMNAKERGKKIK